VKELTGKDPKETPFLVKKLFYILIMVVFTWVSTFVKTQSVLALAAHILKLEQYRKNQHGP